MPKPKQIILPIVFQDKKSKETARRKLKILAAQAGMTNGELLLKLLEDRIRPDNQPTGLDNE